MSALTISRQAVTSSGWVALTSPSNCDNIAIRNDSGIDTLLLRSDPANANTQILLINGYDYIVNAPSMHYGVSFRWRFPVGVTVLYGMLNTGSGTIAVIGLE